MTRTAGAPIGCQRPSRFWGLGCPKIYHEVEDTLANTLECMKALGQQQRPNVQNGITRIRLLHQAFSQKSFQYTAL
ncbi:hypothetical protein, partial [Thiolapillus sp.]